MSSIFITGSSDGLGVIAARQLIADGHDVTLHARSADRADDALLAAPGAGGVLVGELSSLRRTRELAARADEVGPFDAVIHNAGIGYRQPRRSVTEDGVEHVFHINVLAPYVLTALIAPPARLVYLSSGMHRSGDPGLDDLLWERRPWDGTQAYADSKLFDVVLAFAVARLWPEARVNAVDPGWVATKMGGAGASHDLEQGGDTQAWLAVSDDAEAAVTGRYVRHRRVEAAHPAASDVTVQDALLTACAQLSGVAWPARVG